MNDLLMYLLQHAWVARGNHCPPACRLHARLEWLVEVHDHLILLVREATLLVKGCSKSAHRTDSKDARMFSLLQSKMIL